MYVYTINQEGRPLMPCRPRKARILLKNKKAKVIRRTPFTIQLLYETTDFTQPMTLGIDPGSKHIGISVTNKTTVFYESETEIRTDISKNIATRREIRRSRRNRKTRYRKPRFDNRKKKDG